MTTPIPVWTAYSTLTGLWAGIARGHVEMIGPLPSPPDWPDTIWVEGEHAQAAYWWDTSTQALVPRTPVVPVVSGLAIADGETELEILGLPLGAQLWVKGPPGVGAMTAELTASPLVLTFSAPGPWKVLARLEPTHQDCMLTIQVAAL